MPSVLVEYQVEGQEKKGVGCSVITSALRRQEMSNMSGDVLISPFSTDDSGSQNWISRGQTRSNG